MTGSSFISVPALKESQMALWRCKYKLQLWVSAPRALLAIFPIQPLLALNTCLTPDLELRGRRQPAGPTAIVMTASTMLSRVWHSPGPRVPAVHFKCSWQHPLTY